MWKYKADLFVVQEGGGFFENIIGVFLCLQPKRCCCDS